MKKQENKNSILINLSWSFAEKILTELVSTIITIILARLLLPEDYGLVALVQVFINISAIFVECGLGESLIQNKNSTSEQESTVFYINLIIGIILYLILFIAAPYIAKAKGNLDLTSLLRVLALKLPISSVYNIQNSYVKKKMLFKKFFFSSLFGTVLSGVVGILMAYHGFGAWALVASTLTDQIFDSIILFISTKWLPKFQISIHKSKDMLVFGSKILLSEFISRFATQARSLLIGIKYSSADLAYDTKGSKFPQSIANLTSSSIVKVMFPVFADLQDDEVKMKMLVRKCIQMCTYIIAPMMIGLFAISDNFIAVILTEKWLECVPFLQIYCIANLLNIISAIDLRIVSATNHADALVKIRIVDVTFELILIGIAAICFNNAIYIALAILIGQCFDIIVEMYATKKIINYGYFGHFEDMFPSILAATIMGVIVFVIGKIMPSYKLLSMIIQIIAGSLSYLAVSILFRLKPYLEAKKFIVKKLKR